jgi:hypothetical protein
MESLGMGLTPEKDLRFLARSKRPTILAGGKRGNSASMAPINGNFLGAALDKTAFTAT